MSEKLSNTEYQNFIKKRSGKSPIFKDCAFAFLIGGAICVIGQILLNLYLSFNLSFTDASGLVSVTLIFLSILFTGLDIYDGLAKFAGAGTIVPITGFANAVASPAIEYKSDGYILGVGAKMFVVAGPVIVYGIVSSFVTGLIYYFFTL